MPAARPRRRQDLIVVELDGEAVVYDEQSGNVHHLNPSATLVFSLLEGKSTVATLACEIADAFGLPEQEVISQVRSLVAQLREQGLLEKKKASMGEGDVARR